MSTRSVSRCHQVPSGDRVPGWSTVPGSHQLHLTPAATARRHQRLHRSETEVPQDQETCASACSVTSVVSTLWDPMGCSPPGSSVHGILQARIVQRVATPSSRGSSRPRDRSRVSCIFCIASRYFTAEPPFKRCAPCQLVSGSYSQNRSWKRCKLLYGGAEG